MNKKSLWIVIAVIVILIIVSISVKSSSVSLVGTAEQPIKIGAVLSLSGAAVQDGESIKNGVELAKADLKKQGVNVEVFYQDDQTDGKGVVSAIRALSIQGVDALIGPTWSFLGDAGVPVADQLGLVAMMPANTSEYVNASSSYAFYTTTKVNQLVPALTQWLKENNVKSIAITSNEGSWYQTVEKALTEAAAKAGAKIVDKDLIVFGQEASAMPTILAKMKKTNADLYFMEIDSDEGVAIMFKKMKELGMTGKIMSVSTSLSRVLKSNSQGFGLTNNVYVLAPKPPEAFIEKYKGAYGQAPSAYADTAYDSLMILVDAIQKKGDMQLKDYLKTKTDYKGYAHDYKFDSNGDIIGGEWVVTKVK